MKTSKIQEAFKIASSQFQPVKLRGRGHADRASVGTGGAISRAAWLGANESSYTKICGSKHGAPRRVFDARVIHRAEEILGLERGALVGRYYL